MAETIRRAALLVGWSLAAIMWVLVFVAAWGLRSLSNLAEATCERLASFADDVSFKIEEQR